MDSKATGDTDIKERLASLITQQLGVSLNDITEDKSFVDDLGCDSIDRMDLIMAMEDAFDLDGIPEDKAETIRTVGDAIAYIQSVRT